MQLKSSYCPAASVQFVCFYYAADWSEKVLKMSLPYF